MGATGFQPRDVRAFRYLNYELEISGATVTLGCHYALDDLVFTETVAIEVPPGTENPSEVELGAAARLVHLLAGVSYFKAAAPPRIEIGEGGLTPPERHLLEAFYGDGLGEFAYRNDLNLDGLHIDADERPVSRPTDPPSTRSRPLIPFGGGIDSIVTVDGVRTADPEADSALFVMSRANDRFAAIEVPAAATALPIVRAERTLDPKILRSADYGFLNGHVPVTGVLSAVAVLAAVASGRNSVVMSNEWSASMGNLVHNGRMVNHQWSKSLAFEELLRQTLVTSSLGNIDYFSWLRPFSELWVARRFAALNGFHPLFRSCNRSFHLDPTSRLDTWCGQCDKCCFIDLILSPYLSAEALRGIFSGAEPLADPSLAPKFRVLAGLGDGAKPFECVGDVDECRVAVLLASERPDRGDNLLLRSLADETRVLVPGDPNQHAAALLVPLGPHHIPPGLAPQDLRPDHSPQAHD